MPNESVFTSADIATAKKFKRKQIVKVERYCEGFEIFYENCKIYMFSSDPLENHRKWTIIQVTNNEHSILAQFRCKTPKHYKDGIVGLLEDLHKLGKAFDNAEAAIKRLKVK